MSTNKAKKRPAKKAEWKGYHKVNLTDGMAKDFEKWRVDQRVQISDFDALCNNGYKISFSWDDYHEGVSASLYCTQQKMAWAGYVLSAWAGDIETAILLLFYKHYVICEEEWDIAPDVVDKGLSPYG